MQTLPNECEKELTVLEKEILSLNRGKQVTVYIYDGTKGGKREELFILSACKISGAFLYVMHRSSRPRKPFSLEESITICANKGYYLMPPLQIVGF